MNPHYEQLKGKCVSNITRTPNVRQDVRQKAVRRIKQDEVYFRSLPMEANDAELVLKCDQ